MPSLSEFVIVFLSMRPPGGGEKPRSEMPPRNNRLRSSTAVLTRTHPSCSLKARLVQGSTAISPGGGPWQLRGLRAAPAEPSSGRRRQPPPRRGQERQHVWLRGRGASPNFCLADWGSFR